MKLTITVFLLSLLFPAFHLTADQHCTINNPREALVPADAPESITLEGYAWQMPWGYNKPENADRKYPLVVFTQRGEASFFFTTAIRQQYPAIYVYSKDTTNEGAEKFVAAVNALIDNGCRIDLKRIYLTGWSFGGSITFRMTRAFHNNGHAVAAISRIAGDLEHIIPACIFEETSVWLHWGGKDKGNVVGGKDRQIYMPEMYSDFKNYPGNATAVETTNTVVLSVPGNCKPGLKKGYTAGDYTQITKTLTKNGIEIVKYSVYPELGHLTFAFYEDPAFLEWLFSRKTCMAPAPQ